MESVNNNSKIGSETNLKWTPDDIKYLITLYEEYYESQQNFHNIPKKKIWEDIAQQFQDQRFKMFTADQCNGKWKGLKSMYRKIKDHNNTSGNSRKTWEYYDDMDRILYREPEVNRPATCTSDEIVTTIRPDAKLLDWEFHDIIEEESAANYVQDRIPTTSRKRKLQDKEFTAKAKRNQERLAQNGRFLDLFEARIPTTSRKTKLEDEEIVAKTKRHQERMAQNERFLDLFEKLVDRIIRD